jgi:hypothetical protein
MAHPAFDQAALARLGIGASHRGEVDPQGIGQGPLRRQPHTRLQPPGGDIGGNGSCNRQVKRAAITTQGGHPGCRM